MCRSFCLRVVYVALLALAGGGGCLFSTTAPQRSDSGGGSPPVDPNEVVLTGLVRQYDLTDHHYRAAPEWVVVVTWYGADRNGDQQPDILSVATTRSAGSGVYTLRNRDVQTVAADVAALVCAYDPDLLEGCLVNPRSAACAIWTAPRRVAVEHGRSYQQDVVVPCVHVP